MFSPASARPRVMVRVEPQEMAMESNPANLSAADAVQLPLALFCQETVAGLRQRTSLAKLIRRRVTSERSLALAEQIERSPSNDATVSECVDRARSEIADATTRRYRRHQA
jgi:hypothetical protein